MSRAIGLRLYQLKITRKGATDPLPFSGDHLDRPLNEFVEGFIASNSAARSDAELQRSWYFEPAKPEPFMVDGFIHYGTFGFESNLKSVKSGDVNYRRKKDDVEEIPLFFEFWFPEKADFGIVTLQSFQGRSCVTLVMESLKAEFETKHEGLILRYSKLIPSDDDGSFFSSAPVKRLRLIKRNTASDSFSSYSASGEVKPVDIEVVVSAKRRHSLGAFGSMSRDLKTGSEGVILYEGMQFQEAIADVVIGKKVRPVGIFGDHKNAGVIDVSEDVVYGDDGHPTRQSLKKVTKAIAQDFYRVLAGL